MALERRRLGRTGLEVSCLGLGAMGVISHYHSDPRTAHRLVHRALDLGVDFIDTAASYFDSEEILGQALRGRWDQVTVATKSNMRSARRFGQEFEQSFRRMRTDHIHLYQLHHVQYPHELERLMAPGGACDLLQKARDRGRIDFIGITSHHPGVLQDALKTGLFDTVQFPFNPIEAANFQAVMDTAVELDIGTLGMKALSGGRLTAVEAALRWVAAHDMQCILVGCTTLEQLERDVAALEGDLALSDDDRAAMEEEINALGDLFCRRCRYCERVCREGIPISDVFRCHDYLVLNQNYARDEYAKLPIHADRCEECGACEKICPYELPVRDMLKTADSELSRSRWMDLAVRVLHRTHTYDIARRVFFRIRGAGALPQHKYLHRKKDIVRTGTHDKDR